MNTTKRLYVTLLCILCFVVSVYAQAPDTLCIEVREVVVKTKKTQKPTLAAQQLLDISADEIHLFAGHSLMDALQHAEGVQSMDIGVGFSKPMIRGLGFQRIAVTENGIKQEGQQWGADHGLEIDAFHVDDVRIIKGPASVLYGSDAMGGVVEIQPAIIPRHDTLLGEIALQNQTVSNCLSGSAMLGVKRGHWFTRLRYTERHWSDYKVPADSFVYLSMRLPIYNQRLKNTAGFERSANALISCKYGHFQERLAISNSYQKQGFFSGAHGIPSSANLVDDGDKWNISLPYNWVNHFKAASVSKWSLPYVQVTLTLGYQLNHREEWSKFHTHEIGKQPPLVDPDKELEFNLHTISSGLQFMLSSSTTWEHYIGVSAENQLNTIGGYSFLIPEFKRYQAGIYYLVNYRKSARLTMNASARYDLGFMQTDAHEAFVPETDTKLGDCSFAFGAEYQIDRRSKITASIGRGFRMPSANELTSNGVHHGAFRHELGDTTLVSEQGWQLDIAYSYKRYRIEATATPFVSYYGHYISLHPTGHWSSLADAGQIYQYVDSKSTFCGGELKVKTRILDELFYTFSGEYVRTYDMDTHTALPYSPPALMRNTLEWESGKWRAYIECQSVAAQNRVCINEDTTPGYSLFHTGGSLDFNLGRYRLSLQLTANNLLNKPYMSHISFYRKVFLPESGRNFLSTIRLTF